MEHAQTLPRVLLAEEDLVSQQLLSAHFARIGWSCEIVTDAAAVLKAVAAMPFDIVITDVEMPNIGGLELLRSLRVQRPEQAVIVMTRSADISRMTEFIREGAVDFLEKPLDFELVNSSIRRVLHAVRQHAGRSSLYRYVVTESTRFRLTSLQLTVAKLHLPVLERLYQSGRLKLNDRLKIELAFQEALANSLEHGNLELQSIWREDFNEEGVDRYSLVKQERLQDPIYAARMITVDSVVDGDSLEIIITDEGPGFSKGNLMQETPGEAVPVHGRGLAIIHAAIDEVRSENGGRTVIMRKRLIRG